MPDDYSTLRGNLRSFRISLQATNKAPNTIKGYMLSADKLAGWLDDNDRPAAVADIDRRDLEAHLAEVIAETSAANAAYRFRSLQQLFKYLVDVEAIDRSPMDRMSKPAVPDKPVPVVPDADIAKLLAVTKSGREFEDKRDRAILQLFVNTPCRLSEITDRTVADVDFDYLVLRIVAKGRRPRAVPFDEDTARDLDRYLRARSTHRLADTDWLWLSYKGKFTTSGIGTMLKRRCREAGITELHPHQFRHTFAHRWLAAGGQEGDLQRMAGWKDRQMLARYASSAGEERAVEAYRRSWGRP